MCDTATAHDPEESTPTDHRYAGLRLDESVVVSDTECEGARVQSTVSLALVEVA